MQIVDSLRNKKGQFYNLILDDNDDENVNICWRSDRYSGTGFPLSPRGRFLEQMVASMYDCQLTVDDPLSEGPSCYV